MVIVRIYINNVAQDCDDFIAIALELPLSCIKPSISEKSVFILKWVQGVSIGFLTLGTIRVCQVLGQYLIDVDVWFFGFRENFC